MKNSSDDVTAGADDEHRISPPTSARRSRDIVLETFFYELTGAIDNFKNLANRNLKVFTVIGQPVTSLDGIGDLKHLTELWVCEGQVEDASAVIYCTELRKLYLYSNRLTSAPKTTGLTKLTTLSLACNQIKELELCFSESIREINLADNGITDIQNLAMCRQAEIVNLSGNNLSTLKSLGPLQKLPKLRQLSFLDPMYGTSLVANLANYRSYVVHTLRELNCLDGATVETKERDNARIFMEKNFRYYRVLYNNFVNACFTEHARQLERSFTDLADLRNAMINTMVTLSKPESSTMEKDCRKKQRKYEVVQFRWERQHRSWLPLLKAFLDVKCFLVELEMLHFGNVNFVHHTEEGHSSVKYRIGCIVQSFICPYVKRNVKLSTITVNRVVQVINIQHHCFDRFKGIKDVMGIGISDSQYFIVSQPSKISNAKHWLRTFLKRYVDLDRPNMSCLVTNSLAIADHEWLEKNCPSNQRSSGLDDSDSARVLVLGYVISDELMGSFTRHATATMHLKIKEEPTEHCHHCAVYSSVISANVVPAFVVEYSYNFKDADEADVEDEYAIPEKEVCPIKLSIATSKFSVASWQNLTSLNVSKTMLSSFGTVPSLEGITDLDVSYNRITSLQEIAKIFPKLVKLDASYNEISVANFGKEMDTVISVDLKYNCIAKFTQSLQWLKKYCKSLEKLDLAFNPVADVHCLSHIKYLAIYFIPKLKTLDDDWLVSVKGEPIVYKFALKDFHSSSTVTIEEQEAIQSRPKLRYCGESCLSHEEDGSVTPSHFAVNELGDLICVYFDEWQKFQRLEITMKTHTVKWLTIKNNLLGSLNFVEEFPSLEELDLSNNLIHQCSPSAFKTTKHLVKLNLSFNYLRDLDNFANFTLDSLKVLNVSYNFIRKLDPLKNQIHLEELYAAGNSIKKCEPVQFIKEWKELKIIDLSENPIEDPSMCKRLLIYHGTHLEYVNGLAITCEEIADANDTLSGTLNKSYLSKLYKPGQMKSLTELTMKKSGIRKVNLREADLQNLTSVNLEGNAITTIGALGYLKMLKHLCLSRNKIASFGDVKRTFESLERLHLDFNGITDLRPLEFERFPRLTALFLQDNNLSTVEGIKELRRLQYLVIDRNKITVIKPNDLVIDSLKELYLEFNLLKDISFLRCLRNLSKLFLAYNKIQDKTSLEVLASLKKLSDLTVIGNPVSRQGNHYMLILSLLPKLALLDGHTVNIE